MSSCPIDISTMSWAHQLVTSGFSENLKGTRLTVRFQTQDHTKSCQFEKMPLSDDIDCLGWD